MQVASSPNTGAVEAVPNKQIFAHGNFVDKSISDFNALLSLLIGGAPDNQRGQLTNDSENHKQGSTDPAPDKRREPQSDPTASLGIVPASQALPQPLAIPDPSLVAQSKSAGTVPVHLRGAGLANQLPIESPGTTLDPRSQQTLGDLADVRRTVLNQDDPIAFAAQLTELSKADKKAAETPTPALKTASDAGLYRQGAGNSPKVAQSTLKIPIQQKDSNAGGQNSSDNSRQPLRQSVTSKAAPKDPNYSNPPTDSGTSSAYDGLLHPLEATPRQDTAAKILQPPVSSPAEQLEWKSEINQTLRPPPAREIALRLSGNETGQLDLRITERAGKVQVLVRTSDESLSSSLQSNLGDLVGRLEKKGFATETWTSDHRSAHIAGPETANNNSDSGNPSPPGGQSQTDDPRHGQQKNRPQWLKELESSSPEEEEGATNDE